MEVGEFAHADGEVRRRTAFGDLDPAPGAVGIEEDEQVGGAVTPVFAVVTLDLPGFRRDRPAPSPINWIGLSSMQTTGRCGSGASA
jgi:hypothetical protein